MTYLIPLITFFLTFTLFNLYSDSLSHWQKVIHDAQSSCSSSSYCSNPLNLMWKKNEKKIDKKKFILYFSDKDATEFMNIECPFCPLKNSVNYHLAKKHIQEFYQGELNTTQISNDPNASYGSPINLTENDRRDLMQGAIDLQNYSTPEDIILFIGRTPTWLMREFKNIQNRRIFYQLNYSGKADMDQNISNLLLPSRYLGYRKYLTTNVNLHQLAHSPSARILLVDMLYEGKGMLSFVRLLERIWKDEGLEVISERPPLEIIDLSDNFVLPQDICRTPPFVKNLEYKDGYLTLHFENEQKNIINIKMKRYSLHLSPSLSVRMLNSDATDRMGKFFPPYLWASHINEK